MPTSTDITPKNITTTNEQEILSVLKSILNELCVLNVQMSQITDQEIGD